MMLSFEKISAICVCGAGTMGSGIAQLAAQAGYRTIQYDVNETMLAKSKAGITISLQKLAEKNKITANERDTILNRVTFTSDLKECRADIIIEAVVENKNVKAELFNALALHNSPDTIFATNTSSISVSEIAAATSCRHHVLGMHFFNPAPLMKLVEIVRSGYCEETTVGLLVSLARQMGKTPVVCNDAPGFIVNRVARHYYLENLLLAEKGLSDIKTIDAVMESTGFKMGPFKLMDLIGLDVNYAVSNIVWEALGKPDRLQPSALQQEKVKNAELGRKTGRGFYDYQ